MAKTLAVLNPISGNGAGARVWSSIEQELKQGGLDFDVARTSSPGHAVSIANEARRSGYETLIAVGGDGTTNEVANGLAQGMNGAPGGRLGVIPVGSGNDFCKMLAIKPDWHEGVARILAGKEMVIDVGRVVADQPPARGSSGAWYFVNALDTGFGALVAQHAHEVPFLNGMPMYMAAVFKTLLNYSVPHVRLAFDDSHLEQDSTMIAFGNGRCIGSTFWITPTAAADDGVFDVIVADGLGRLGILSLLPKVMKGTHIGDPRVKFLQTRRAVIDSDDPLTVETDGEIPFVGVHRLEIEILPKHLRVIA